MYVVVTMTRSGYVDDVFGPFETMADATDLAHFWNAAVGPGEYYGAAVVRDVRRPAREFDPTAQAAEGEVSA